MIVFLDTSLLSLVSSPRRTNQTQLCQQWFYQLLARGVYVVSSDICDYEVRRSLILASFINPKVQGIDNLDSLHFLIDFFPITQKVLTQSAQLWADSRRRRQPTAELENIDADVIIAATCQLLDFEYPGQNLVVATTNVKHLSRFVNARTWTEIRF